MIPAIYDNGTHYVANHRLSSEMLEQICKDEDVLEVTREYTGGIGGWGASHEHREHRHTYEDDHNAFCSVIIFFFLTTKATTRTAYETTKTS
jgi:hypothetical protein